MFMSYFGVWMILSAIYTFAVMNVFYLYKKKQLLQSIQLTEFLWLYLILLLLPALMFFLLLMLCYRQIVCMILSVKYGNQFGGLLGASDIIHVVENPKRSKLRVLFVIKYKTNQSRSFYETVNNAIVNTKLINCPKARAVVQKYFGYYYYLKHIVEISECIHKITFLKNGNKIIDKSSFMTFLHESEDIPLPMNNFGLWDVFIGTNPIKWNCETSTDGYEYYPILFRYHHCLFDGFHLIKTIFDNFADYKIMDESTDQTNMLRKKLHVPNLNSNPSFVFKTLKLLRSLCGHVYVIGILPWRFLMLTKTLAKDTNTLCRKELSDKKLFSFYIEKSSHYVKVIKEIKKKYPGSSFTDIILTALSASLTKYLKNTSSSNVPKYITVATPEVPQATALLHITNAQERNAQFQCQNKVLFSLRKLPISDNFVTIYDRLKIINKQGSYFKNPSDVQADYIAAHVCFMLLPSPFLLRLMKCISYTAIVTNLPGPSSTTFCGGHYLQDMVIWSISKETTATGISFIILTYDNRLEVTMSADQSVISSHSDVESIVKNIYSGLSELEYEVNKYR